jgi:hypothetical protein
MNIIGDVSIALGAAHECYLITQEIHFSGSLGQCQITIFTTVSGGKRVDGTVNDEFLP